MDPIIVSLAVYLLLGAFAGTVAGLLGVGGGLIIVPVLAAVFALQHFDTHIVMHLAIGTSLATIVVTSISSGYAHHLHGAVLWPVFIRIAPGITVGAWLGAWLASILPTESLKLIFGLFELLVAVQMAFSVKPKASTRLPNTPGLSVVGVGIGTVSTIVGIGGGTLTVPFLSWCKVSIHHAIATSAACGIPIAIAGSLGFIVVGLGTTTLPDYSTGFVYWPAFSGVILTSMLFAPLGAKLAHRLSKSKLTRIFAVFLAGLGTYMILG